MMKVDKHRGQEKGKGEGEETERRGRRVRGGSVRVRGRERRGVCMREIERVCMRALFMLV